MAAADDWWFEADVEDVRAFDVAGDAAGVGIEGGGDVGFARFVGDMKATLGQHIQGHVDGHGVFKAGVAALDHGAAGDGVALERWRKIFVDCGNDLGE